MEVVYVDVSEAPRKVLGSMSHVASFYVWFFVAALFLGAPAIVIGVNTPKDGPLWQKVLAVTLMACAWMLPFAAGYVQKQPLRSSGLRIAPYGVSLRQVLRALAKLRQGLDRSTGWTRRRVVTLAVLVRVAAVAVAAAAVAYGTRGGLPKDVGGPMLLGGLSIAAVLWIVVAGRLLRPKQRDPRLLAKTTLRRLAGLAVFLAVALAYVAAFGIAHDYWRGQPPWYITIAILCIGGAVGVAAYDHMSSVWTRAKAELHPVTADLRRWDKRRPVLLLRSFHDDAQSAQHENASTWDETTEESLEEAVGARLGRYGPYIAVGEPGTGVTGGAARDRFQGDAWREAVQTWMDEAIIIAMVAGWSEGVRWELEQVVARGHVEKLLLVLPGGANMDARWRQACKSFSGTRWHAALLGIDTRFALAVHCTPRGVVVIASRARSAGHYAAAAELALYGMCCAKPAAA